MVRIRVRCPGCGLRLMDSWEDGYRCVACGSVFIPPPDWIGPIWAEEREYKRSIAKRKGGSRKAGRKRSRKPHLTRKRIFEGEEMQ